MAFVAPSGAVEADERVRATADGVRLAAELVDMPTSQFGPDAFVERARDVAKSLGSDIEIIRGEQLRDRGFGGERW